MIAIKILLFGDFSGERARVVRLFGRADLIDYDAPLSHFVTSRFKTLLSESDFAILGGEPKFKAYVTAAKKSGCKLALWGCEAEWIKRCQATLGLFDLIFARDKETYTALREAGYNEVVLSKAEPIEEPPPVLTPEPVAEDEPAAEPEPLEEPELLIQPAIQTEPPSVSPPKPLPLLETEEPPSLPGLGTYLPPIRPVTSAYGVVNRNENIRAASAAGGVFTLLCEEIIGRGGVVFGARYSEQFETVHTKAERMPECTPMRGIKYALGETEGIYAQAISCLRQGTPVLFTGTSCQIEQLYQALGGDHELLLTADMICGGAAEPSAFAAYLKYTEEKNGAPATAVDLSGKPGGRASARVGSENGTYEVPANRDPFLRAYRAGLCLRLECHQCTHRGERRASDLTLGGFPGGRRHIPELYDDMGASLVLAHSQKGRDMMDALASRAIVSEVPPDALPQYNEALITPPAQHKNRERFYADLPNLRFDKAVSRSIGPPIWGILTQKRYILPVWKKIWNNLQSRDKS